MDYSLVNALQYNMQGICHVISFYDINCTYMRKLRQHVGNNEFLNFPKDMEIAPGIRIWHVHGHQLQCFSRYAPLYIEGAGWIDGEVIETLWSILNVVSRSTHGMSSPHGQELLDFQMNDSNFMKMICMGRHLATKWKNELLAPRAAGRAFDNLNSGIPEAERGDWMDMEHATLNTQVDDPSTMDIFQLKTNKAASIQTVEMDLLGQHASSVETPQGTVTWLAQGLSIEESATHVMKNKRSLKSTAIDIQKLVVAIRMDWLSSNISKFIDAATTYMGSTIEYHDDTTADESESEWEEQNEDPHSDLPLPFIHLPALPLSSSLGCRNCNEHGLAALAELELQLCIGQVNDTIHSICFTLADKAVLFHTKVCHTSNQSGNTCTWGKVHQADTVLSRHAQIYRKYQKAMVALEADETLLERYKPLADQYLKVMTAISDPNGSIHHMADLTWFWTMDIPRDAQESDWMSECRLYICSGQFKLIEVLSLPHKLAVHKGSPGSMD
ncbi:hypothetical protein PAXRUDRAFT_160879 [Paxillus rubicundulus Ve08.2h10]|uniref:CxC2-like cysteine cluster KDZ transposase-associated domain-containing protein n=1 Tax=Paxillus rubicundulus Ve08.2h10 TaxID=930991 RepID=A0A0D0DF41_9AGAM|nr:hypothetical protein PAXRUDRAFT_160879 [Paxillus rubicundulus Ve08.2h10]